MMTVPVDDMTLDLSIFIIINIAHVAIFAMFVLRVKKKEWAGPAGTLTISMGIPTGIIAVINLLNGRDWWLWVYPFLFVVFCLFTYIVDYALKIEFRKPRNLKILVPFLLIFYISIILMWGVTWSIGPMYGAITGVTYFMQLGAAGYAGKHGVG